MAGRYAGVGSVTAPLRAGPLGRPISMVHDANVSPLSCRRRG